MAGRVLVATKISCPVRMVFADLSAHTYVLVLQGYTSASAVCCVCVCVRV